MDNNISNSFKTLGEQTNLLAEKRASWHHQLLVASSALFGILISLHNGNSLLLFVRLVFALSVVLLALGIFLIGISLYSHIDAVSRARKAATEEAILAAREHRAMKPVAVPVRKIFSFCEKASYICFGLSVLLLAAYSVLIAVYQS
ncbi:hypothetical protein M2451_003351 [Dysgonomonas sp. PFB1-18]|uniref:hypothetical protein n=1 Tax=unclassified Dysgonomonas TaxID=2630389 RepID=UPI002473E44F|nr:MULTISPECIES: hypothetical protein [unclassified Dysgonomonas]MDH6310559.1 hypothetical protein [Dysgonomonas sp. PF1-14]MDH6340409.1 hypothetical protein [Dysgonomonas sp. PF1-16]MDH6382011.1 hypothetical protein [Dysgonomonas sp. PFB1-18]MDH6399380.1 hypothetical protein [Dysgonomonas sp. PF1-23]